MSNVTKIELKFRKLPNDPNMFEFTVSSPLLRSQFCVPRAIVNQLRVDLEKALTR